MPSLDSIRLALRDLFIASLLLAFLIWPSLPSGLFRSLGITHADTVFGTFDFSATTAQAQNTSKVSSEAEALVETIDTARKDPATASAPFLDQLQTLATSLSDHATQADAAVKTTLAAQIQALPASAAPPPSDGWIFLGRTGPAQDRWRGRPTTDAASPRPDQLQGRTLTMVDDTYLRSAPDTPPTPLPRGWRANQPIIGVVKVGQHVQVVAAEVDPALGNGFSAWAQVRKLP